MANTEEKYSRPRMIPRQEQSLDRAHHSAEVGSDGNLQGSSLNRSQMRRGYHTDDNYRAPRRRGDPSHDDYSRNDDDYGRSRGRGRGRGRDGFSRYQDHSRVRQEGREGFDMSDGHYGPPMRGSMEGRNPNREAENSERRFNHREHHRASFDELDSRSNFDVSDRPERSSRRSPERSQKPKPKPKEREWPPCFHIDGSAFVFDNRSAMFYEPESNFFYDPKSKLYYGNRKGAYYRYDKSQSPPFVEVQKLSGAATGGDTTQDASQVTVEPIQNTLTKPKPTIAINLKTLKKAKQHKGSLQKKVAPVVSKVEKQRIANIEKWNEKQAELKPESSLNIRTTVKGEPICTICKRKFPTIEKLRLHERASELHKANLAKLAKAKEAESAKRKELPAGTYEDRAQKRRNLHGSASVTPNKPGIHLEKSSANEPVSPEGLGSNNIGNQMLKKMGWQQSGKPEEGQQLNLRKDWDRIESRASSGQRPPR